MAARILVEQGRAQRVGIGAGRASARVPTDPGLQGEPWLPRIPPSLACGWSVVLAPSASAISDSRAAGADNRWCSRLKKAERCTACLDGSPGSGEGERRGAAPGAPAGSPAAGPAGSLAGRCSGTAEALMAAAASATAGWACRQCASQSSCPTTAAGGGKGVFGTRWARPAVLLRMLRWRRSADQAPGSLPAMAARPLCSCARAAPAYRRRGGGSTRPPPATAAAGPAGPERVPAPLPAHGIISDSTGVRGRGWE